MSLERYGLGAIITADDRPFVQATGRARDSLGQFISVANNAPAAMSRMASSISRATVAISQGAAQMATGAQQIGSGLRNAALGALPLALAVGSGVVKAAQFERQMSAVGSVTRSDEQDMAKLNTEAKRMGIISVFSATQAGEAMEYLGRAGASADQIIASLQGTMNAAAADSMELSSAADIIAQTVKAMGLQWGDAGHVADVLALTSASANTNIIALGESFRYGASMAKGLDISLEQTATIFGKLADSGLKGSIAGTSFTNMMNKLIKPSEKAAAVMEKWKIKLEDGNKNLRPISSIIQDISDKMEKVPSAAERAALGVELFGLRGVKAYNALRMQGKEAIDDLENKLIAASYGVGAATEMADRRLDNFLGRLTLFGASVESLSIGLFSPLLKSFTPVVEQMTDGLNSVLFSLDALNAIRTEESRQNADSAQLIAKETSNRLQTAGAVDQYARSTRSAIQVLSRMQMSEEDLSRAQIEARKRGVLASFEAESRRQAEAIKIAHMAAANIKSEKQMSEARVKMMNQQIASMTEARRSEAQKQIDLAFSGAKGSVEAQQWLRRRVIEEALSSNKSLSNVQKEAAIQEINNMIMLESEASKRADSIRAQIFSIEKLQEIEKKYGSSAVQIALGMQEAVNGIITAWENLVTKVKEFGKLIGKELGPTGLRDLSKYATYFSIIAAAVVPVALSIVALSFVLGGLSKAFIGLKNIAVGAIGVIKGILIALNGVLWPVAIVIGALALAFAIYRREEESFGNTMTRLWGDIKKTVASFYETVKTVIKGFLSRWNEISNEVYNKWNNLWDKIGNHLKETSSKIKGIFNKIFGHWFKSSDDMEIKWEDVGTAIANSISLLSSFIINTIDLTVNSILTAVNIVTSIVDTVLDHVYSFAHAIEYRWEELKRSFINLWNVASESFRTMYNDVVPLISELISIFSIFTSSTESNFTSLYSSLGALFANLVGILSEALAIVIPIASNIFGNVLNTVSTTLYNIKRMFADTFGGILQILEGDFLGGVKRLGIALVNALTSPMRIIINSFLDLVSRIPGADMAAFKLGIDLDSLKKWTKEGLTYEGAGAGKKPKISESLIAAQEMNAKPLVGVGTNGKSDISINPLDRLKELKDRLEAIGDYKTKQQREAAKTPEVNVDLKLEDKRALDIRNSMCVDGESLDVATARHKQEIQDRSGYKSTPWQRRIMVEHGVAPIKKVS